MPYKDKEKQRECQRKWYSNNKDFEIKRVRKRKNKIIKWFKEYKKTLSCTNCQEDEPACLVFHHKDPKKKTIGISSMVNHGLAINTIKKEMEKCIVLCANCHRKLHWGLV